MQHDSIFNKIKSFFQTNDHFRDASPPANFNLLEAKKIAYLTIDDSPSKGFLSKLNYLEQKKIPTLFFCIGLLMEKRPEEIVEAIQRGFQIANHSYTHPHFSKTTLEKCQYEIEKTDDIINQLYEKANVKRTQKWFRFPYGDKGDLKNGEIFNKKKKRDETRFQFIQKVLRDLEYIQPHWSKVNYNYMKNAGLLEDLDSHWTFDIMEWAMLEKKPTFGIRSLENISYRLLESQPKDCRGQFVEENRWLESPSAEIILLHDHDATTPIFEKIIDQLLELPLQFEQVTN